MKDKHEKVGCHGCQAHRSIYKDFAICGILLLFPEYVIRWCFCIFLGLAEKSANIFWERGDIDCCIKKKVHGVALKYKRDGLAKAKDFITVSYS
jgi:hypothetical protein